MVEIWNSFILSIRCTIMSIILIGLGSVQKCFGQSNEELVNKSDSHMKAETKMKIRKVGRNYKDNNLIDFIM